MGKAGQISFKMKKMKFKHRKREIQRMQVYFIIINGFNYYEKEIDILRHKLYR
jgi:hypothetical protein